MSGAWLWEEGEGTVLRKPEEPTEEEVERHLVLGHPVFRSWCPHCVKGAGESPARRHREDREDRGHRGNRAELADTFIKVLKTENRITDSLTGFNNMQRC